LDKIWYLAIARKQAGPFDLDEVRQHLRQGTVDATTLAFAGGVTPNWTPLAQIPQLATLLDETAPHHATSAPPPMPDTAVEADPLEYAIVGDDLQLVEIALAPGHTVVAEAGAMLYMDQSIVMDTQMGDGSASDEGTLWNTLAGAAKRVLTGESLFMTTFTHRGNEPAARVAFSAPYPGKIVPIRLADLGNSLICQKEAFLCGARGVSIGLEFQKRLGAGFFGGAGFILQKLTGSGQVFLHAGGTIIEKDLAPGQTLRLETGCLVAFAPSVTYDVTLQNNIKNALFGGEGLFLATLSGPGRVWLQSLPFSRLAARVQAATRGQSTTSHNS